MGNNLYGNLNIQRDIEEDRSSIIKVDKTIFYLLLTVIIIIPLIIGGHLNEVISPLISDKSELASGKMGDIFSFYKFWALIILTIAAVVLFLYKLYFLNYCLRYRPILCFFLILLFAVIISTLLSPSKTIALYGLYNRKDGALSFICYMSLMFVAMNIEHPKKVINYVLYSLYPLVIINFILITMNFTGHEALTYGPVRRVMSVFLPKGATLADNSTLLGTLNHFNYISGTFSVITVMYLSWVMIDKNKIRRVTNLIFALLSISTLLMAISRSGFLTFVIMIPFIIWLAIKSGNKKMAFISLIVYFVLTASILHVLSSKNTRVWDESVGSIISINPYNKEQSASSSLRKGNSLDLSELLDNKTYAAESKFTLPELPERGWTTGTGRVYIWKETLKLLKERPLFGYGLDTLMYNFPHDNIEARANLYDVTIVDKPHNFYVGVLYGTGILGFIGFLGIVIMIAWQSLKKVHRFNKSS